MERIEWLKGSLQVFFRGNGVPMPLTDVLASRVSALFFDRVDEVVDVDKYYEVLEQSLQKVIASDDYDYDLRAFIGKSVIQDIRKLLGVTSFGRAEIFKKSLEKQFVNHGYNQNAAEKLSALASDKILRSPGFFNLSEKDVQKVVADVLVDMDVDRKIAPVIAQRASLRFVLLGPPLECIEAVEILEPDEFKQLFNSRVEERLAGKLSYAKLQELKKVINNVYFGSRDNGNSEGLSDRFSELIKQLADDDNVEIMDLIQNYFQNFKFPSKEMFLFLQEFTNVGVLVTKSLMDKPEEFAEEERLRVFMQQSM